MKSAYMINIEKTKFGVFVQTLLNIRLFPNIQRS